MGTNDATMNMAIDEAILRLADVPTLRLYRWCPSAISLGYFQSLEDEVDQGACEKMGIDVVRRISGGGAVFHGAEGEITYSVVVAEGFLEVTEDVPASYERLCGGVINALQLLGMDARFQGINDVVVGDKKISGSAQTRRYGKILQHGTVLLDVDIERMFRVLRISEEKLSDKEIKKAEERVTSIRKEVGVVSSQRVAHALARGFEEALGIELIPGSLEEEERALARTIRGKYGSDEWNGMR